MSNEKQIAANKARNSEPFRTVENALHNVANALTDTRSSSKNGKNEKIKISKRSEPDIGEILAPPNETFLRTAERRQWRW
jgi:hypothetical protein